MRITMVATATFLFAIASPSQAVQPVERDGRVYCGNGFVNGLNLPAKDNRDRDHALQIMLVNVDRGYKSAIKKDTRPGRTSRDAQQECRIRAYRLRGRQFAYVRDEAKTSYEAAVSSLDMKVLLANSICFDHAVGSRDWAKCERDASKERDQLRVAVFKAQRAWKQISNPPDFDSRDERAYQVTAAVARAEMKSLLSEDFTVEPLSLGSEVWCGTKLVRSVATVGNPASELDDVWRAVVSAPRQVERAEKKYAAGLKRARSAVNSPKNKIPREDFDAMLEKLRRLREKREAWQCKANWALTREIELADVPATVEARYLKEQAAFDELDQRCDLLKPGGKGWVKADKQTEEWIACGKRTRRERNNQLRVLKGARGWHEALQQNLAKRNEAKLGRVR